MTGVMREAIAERERTAFAIRRADASGTARAITPHTQRTRYPNQPQMHRPATRTHVGTHVGTGRTPTIPMTAAVPMSPAGQRGT